MKMPANFSRSRGGVGSGGSMMAIVVGASLALLAIVGNEVFFGWIFSPFGEFSKGRILWGVRLTQVACGTGALYFLIRQPTVPKHIVGRLLLVFAGLCLAIGIGGVAMELLYRDAFAPIGDPSTKYRIPDPLLGWRLIPDASFVRHRKEASIQVVYNSRGFRDVEHVVSNPENKYRVVVLGDSFMEGFTVQLRESFCRRLEQVASEGGYEIEVINLGVSGYGTLQELLIFLEHGIQFKPDLVMLSFFPGNDLFNNYPYRGTRADHVYRRQPLLNPDALPQWEILAPEYERTRQIYSERIRVFSHLRFLKDLAIVRALSEFRIALKKARPRQLDVREQLVTMGPYYCNEDPEISRAWQVTSAVFKRLKSEVEAIGAELVVFGVPGPMDVGLERIAHLVRACPRPEWLCAEELPWESRLSEILDRLGVGYVSLTEAFRSEVSAGKVLFPVDDNHWNALGHDLASRVVYTSLEQQEFFKAAVSLD